MMTDEPSLISVTWRSRDKPLGAVAVAAYGAVAHQLGRRLLEIDDESLARLKGVTGAGLLILTGDQESLPWINGVSYLGRDSAAPSLLVPTTLEPTIPIALLERVLAKKFIHQTPLAVLPDHQLVAALDVAREVAREALRAWLKEDAKG